VKRLPQHHVEEMQYVQVREAVRQSKEMSEGIVVIKIKTEWWLGAAHRSYTRWLNGAQWELETQWHQKKVSMMEKQELRVVVKGLPGPVSPAFLLNLGAQRVEAFYSRSSGKRGAAIASFESTEAKITAAGSCVKFGLVMKTAYSRRSSSYSWHRIRTWYANEM